MRRKVTQLAARYLLVAGATRAAEAASLGGRRLRCGCLGSCWCQRPGLSLFHRRAETSGGTGAQMTEGCLTAGPERTFGGYGTPGGLLVAMTGAGADNDRVAQQPSWSPTLHMVDT